MAFYSYICIDLKGDYLKGSHEAKDKNELARSLWESSLFLVWWDELAGDAAVTFHEATPVLLSPADLEKMWADKMLEKGTAQKAADPLPMDLEEAYRDAAASYDEDPLWKKLYAWLTRGPQAVLVILACIAYDVRYNIQHHQHMSDAERARRELLVQVTPPDELIEKAASIKSGMKRKEVEALFNAPPQAENSPSSTYKADDHWRVRVRYIRDLDPEEAQVTGDAEVLPQ